MNLEIKVLKNFKHSENSNKFAYNSTIIQKKSKRKTHQFQHSVYLSEATFE